MEYAPIVHFDAVKKLPQTTKSSFRLATLGFLCDNAHTGI